MMFSDQKITSCWWWCSLIEILEYDDDAVADDDDVWSCWWWCPLIERSEYDDDDVFWSEY